MLFAISRFDWFGYKYKQTGISSLENSSLTNLRISALQISKQYRPFFDLVKKLEKLIQFQTVFNYVLHFVPFHKPAKSKWTKIHE